jgi:hypothetical protein
VLALPDCTKSFELVADASSENPAAVGAVLLQEGHPVAFYSRKLSGPELNYSVSDIEMLAVISALREWRCYLEGVPFTIVTDHKPNTYLSDSANIHTTKRRARWLEISCAFDCEWQYRPGRLNVADPVSRAPQNFSILCGLPYLAHASPRCDLAGARTARRGLCSFTCAAYSLRSRSVNDPGHQDADGPACSPRNRFSHSGRASFPGGSDTPATNEQRSLHITNAQRNVNQGTSEPSELLPSPDFNCSLQRAH